MFYKIRSGISWQTVYTRFRRYAIDGVFTRASQQIQVRADAAGDIDWLVRIDSTIVRAHQHAAATGRKGVGTGGTNRTITPSADPEAPQVGTEAAGTVCLVRDDLVGPAAWPARADAGNADPLQQRACADTVRTRHCRHHPREGRPAAAPTEARLPRQPTATI
ncbi:hypothetical protein ACH4JS_31480 [Streptomyces sp. NPDC017638]|uniref:hypothetical protein n=1 Tax=Streptomyces sp. NPDC017638 TaxID=3365004 RepID=UPI00379E383C